MKMHCNFSIYMLNSTNNQIEIRALIKSRQNVFNFKFKKSAEYLIYKVEHFSNKIR